MSSRHFEIVCKGVGPMGFVFVGPEAFPMAHTIDVNDYGGGIHDLTLPCVVRRCDSIVCCL